MGAALVATVSSFYVSAIWAEKDCLPHDKEMVEAVEEKLMFSMVIDVYFFLFT